jgi:hypothetical protein
VEPFGLRPYKIPVGDPYVPEGEVEADRLQTGFGPCSVFR